MQYFQGDPVEHLEKQLKELKQGLLSSETMMVCLSLLTKGL